MKSPQRTCWTINFPASRRMVQHERKALVKRINSGLAKDPTREKAFGKHKGRNRLVRIEPRRKDALRLPLRLLG